MRNPKATKTTQAVAPKRRRPGHEPIKPGQRLLFKPQVIDLLGGIAYSTLWEWMRSGLFPLAVELGPPGGRSTMIAWYADEVHNWIATRPRRRLGQHEFRGPRTLEQIDSQPAQRPRLK